MFWHEREHRIQRFEEVWAPKNIEGEFARNLLVNGQFTETPENRLILEAMYRRELMTVFNTDPRQPAQKDLDIDQFLQLWRRYIGQRYARLMEIGRCGPEQAEEPEFPDKLYSDPECYKAVRHWAFGVI